MCYYFGFFIKFIYMTKAHREIRNGTRDISWTGHVAKIEDGR